MLSLIAAVAKNYCIGKDNRLPWSIPEDLQHFKDVTSGKTVLMGRKTFESILGYLKKPLPNRKSIIITRNLDYKVPTGVEVYNDIDKAMNKYLDEEIFVIGGAGIYKQTIDKADKLYITWIDKEVDGDTFFPKVNKNQWKKITEEKHPGFNFVEYIKK